MNQELDRIIKKLGDKGYVYDSSALAGATDFMSALNSDPKYQYQMEKQQLAVLRVDNMMSDIEEDIQKLLQEGKGSPKKLMKKLERCYEEYDRFNAAVDPIESVTGYAELMAELSGSDKSPKKAK